MTTATREFTGGWVETDAAAGHEFERTIKGHVFRAYRNRTGYGWSWWTVTKDGKPYTSGGELFRIILFV